MNTAVKITVRSSKFKAFVLVKWLSEKSMELSQEDNYQRLTQMQAIRYEIVGLQGTIKAKEQ